MKDAAVIAALIWKEWDVYDTGKRLQGRHIVRSLAANQDLVMAFFFISE